MLIYLIIGVVTVAAMIVISWFQIKADEERARNGLPKKHSRQVFTVITFDHRKD